MTFWHTVTPEETRRRLAVSRRSIVSLPVALPGSLPVALPGSLPACGSDAVAWAETELGFSPDAVQAEILRSDTPG